MASRRANSFYAEPSAGAVGESLGSALFGDGADAATAQLRGAQTGHYQAAAEGQHVQNEDLRRAQKARLQRADRLRTGLVPGNANDILADTSLLPAAEQNSGLGLMRMGAHVQPGNTPDFMARSYVGAGGAYGQSIKGTQEGVAAHSGDVRAVANIGAGATLGAARINNEGALNRLRLTPRSPGADGDIMSPDQRRFYGMAPDPGTGPLPAGVSGPVQPAAYTNPIFLPGSARAAPGSTQTSIVPGIFNPNAPEILTTTAPDRSGTARTSQTANDVVRMLVSPDPAVQAEGQRQAEELRKAGIPLPAMVTPTVVNTQANVTGRQQVADTRIAGLLERTNLTGQQRQELETLRGNMRIEAERVRQEYVQQIQGQRDEAARQRLEAQLAARLQQIELQGQNKLDQLGVSGQTARDVARIGADGRAAGGRVNTPAVPKGFEEEATRTLDAEIETAGYRLDDAARRFVINRASQLFQDPAQQGASFQNPSLAVRSALIELRNAPDQNVVAAGPGSWNPRSTQYGVPLSLADMFQAPAPAAPAARPGAQGNRNGLGEARLTPPATPAAPTTPSVPPAAQRQIGTAYDLPAGRAIWRGDGWEPVSASGGS